MKRIAAIFLGLLIFSAHAATQQDTPAAHIPEITVTDLPEGQQKISILIQKEDGTTQEYMIKVDRQGNQETLIKVTDAQGKVTVSALGQGGQVPVKKLSDVTISKEGILVDVTDPVVLASSE